VETRNTGGGGRDPQGTDPQVGLEVGGFGLYTILAIPKWCGVYGIRKENRRDRGGIVYYATATVVSRAMVNGIAILKVDVP